MSEQKNILLVDDDVDLLDMVQFQMEAKGFKVVTAQNGQEGLKQLETINPDLILLDINMPKMGGVEFYKNICDNEGRPKYPVFVLTARANMEQLFKEFNVDGFISKPFEIDQLISQVQTVIKRRYSENRARQFPGINRGRTICLVENVRESFIKLAVAFLDAGYIVNAAQSGTAAIERITDNVPDVVLIKLDLADVSGEIVIQKLQRMIKTKDIIFVLYKIDNNIKRTVVERKSGKNEISATVASDDPDELLDVIEREFRNAE